MNKFCKTVSKAQEIKRDLYENTGSMALTNEQYTIGKLCDLVDELIRELPVNASKDYDCGVDGCFVQIDGVLVNINTIESVNKIDGEKAMIYYVSGKHSIVNSYDKAVEIIIKEATRRELRRYSPHASIS